MNKHILIKEFVKRFYGQISSVKMYSFRKFTFMFYMNLFVRLSILYLDKVFMILQLIRIKLLFSFFNFFGILSRFIQYNICDIFIFSDYYFNLLLPNSFILYSLYLPTSVELFSFMGIQDYFFYSYLISLVSFFSFSNLISLPNTKKVFTILRSPHTDKKSREQFSLMTYSKLFKDRLNFGMLFLRLLPKVYFSSIFISLKKFNLYY